MAFPMLYTSENSKEMTETMRGYNHNIRIGDGEFYDMENLTSDYYPVLAPRGKRGVYAKPASPQGMIAKDKLCYVDGSTFVIGDRIVEMGLSVLDEDCPKKLIAMGAYVLIFPDKKWINTITPEEFGEIEARYSSTEKVTFSLSAMTGEAYGEPVIAPDVPEDAEDLSYWIDTSVTPHVLKQYSQASGMWVNIAATYIKIASSGIGKEFAQYDGVTISGVTPAGLKELNGKHVIWDRGDDYIVVAGMTDAVISQSGSITVSREMPLMDHMTECGNRIWGCRYGVSADGVTVNEIYASKLGDFKNWNCFMGLSTDSYAASCGTDGIFTGAITHMGYPLFFKENCFHKVYGSYPANFQIQDTACKGVQKGSERSLAIVNGTLFYKSGNGICAFDGSLPAEVSYAFGNVFYTDATAGTIGNKYYVSMKDADGRWHIFVYDSARNLWHREDMLHVSEFCAYQGELYCIDADNKNILTMLGSGTKDNAPVRWMAQTGALGLSSPDMKYIARLILRMSVELQSQVNVFIQYDGDGEWIHICNVRGTGLRSFSVPVRPRRCDYFQVKLEGSGGCKLYSITKVIAQGSDIS